MALPDGLYDLLLTECLPVRSLRWSTTAPMCKRSKAAQPSFWPRSSPGSSAPSLTMFQETAVYKLVTGNDVRARLVVNEWRRLASDAAKSRAIVFCVSVAHAEFMTGWLNRAGLPAACVVGTTPDD